MLEPPNSPSLPTLDGVQAAAYVRRCREAVMREWESRCRQQISGFATKRPAGVGALISEFIDELVRHLDSSLAEPFAQEFQTAKESSEYTLGEVIQEYQLMRSVLLECLRTEHVLSPSTLGMITLTTEKAVRRVANWFCKATELELRAAVQLEKEMRSEVEYSLKELNRVETRLRATITVAKVGFYDWDLIRDQINFSDQMQQDWGLGPSATLEKVMLSVHPADRERMAQKIQTAISTRTTSQNQYRVVRADGSEVWIETQGHATYDDLGRAVRFLGTSLNITERKLTELALQNERHNLDCIVRDSPAAIALWRGENLVFEMVNRSYQNIFGNRKLLGKPLLEAVPELEGQPFFEMLKKVLETGQSYAGHEVLAKIVPNEGAPIEDRYYDFSYVRVCDSQGKPYGVYDHAVDVTDRVVARQKIEESRLRLEQLVLELEKERDIRDRFVATLTHDLRSPLAAARVSAQMMAENAPTDTVTKQANRIVASVDRADKMIQQLLDVSRIQAGESLSLTLAPLDVTALVTDYLPTLQDVYGSRVELVTEGRGTVQGNAVAVKRILDNLCANAVKYGAKAGRVTIRVAGDDTRVALSVHNYGTEIAQGDRQRLFDPFKRTEFAESGNQEGWGLGLAIVRALATAQGGRVELESSENCGTTFTVTIPVGRS